MRCFKTGHISEAVPIDTGGILYKNAEGIGDHVVSAAVDIEYITFPSVAHGLLNLNDFGTITLARQHSFCGHEQKREKSQYNG